MSRKLFLALLLGVLLVSAPFCRADEDEDDDGDEGDAPAADNDEPHVVVLTDKNFDEKLKASKFALIEFYAPWCGHCKALKPEYAKAATAIHEYDPTIVIAKLDATEAKEAAGKFSIQGYPTIKWFVDGKEAMDYSGGRQADDIIRWVKKKTGPATTEVADLDALEAAKKDNKVFVLGFFEEFDGKAHKSFESAAQKNDDAAFLKTTSAEVAAALGIKKAPGYALGRSYDDFGFEAIPAKGHPTFKDKKPLDEKLAALVKAERLPAYIEFSSETSQAIFGSGIDHHVIVTATEEDLTKGSDLTAALLEASKELRGKTVLVTSILGSENGKPIMQFFGLDAETKTPQIVGFHSSGGKKFKFEGKPIAEEIVKFGKAVVDGTAKKFFKSAEEPKEPKDNGVTVVVGNTVESIVLDSKKDVLLEVYAPWCGHCKSLAPTYEKLAKKFEGVDSIVIAKMDGTENEHPDIEAQGYPTLLFFPAEEGAKPIPYSGDRDLKAFVKFLKENAKVKFELPKGKKGKGKKKAAKKEEEKKEEEEEHDEL